MPQPEDHLNLAAPILLATCSIQIGEPLLSWGSSKVYLLLIWLGADSDAFSVFQECKRQIFRIFGSYTDSVPFTQVKDNWISWIMILWIQTHLKYLNVLEIETLLNGYVLFLLSNFLFFFWKAVIKLILYSTVDCIS